MRWLPGGEDLHIIRTVKFQLRAGQIFVTGVRVSGYRLHARPRHGHEHAQLKQAKNILYKAWGFLKQ